MNKLIKLSLTVIFLSFAAANAVKIVNEAGANLKLLQSGTEPGIKHSPLKDNEIKTSLEVPLQVPVGKDGVLAIGDGKFAYYITIFNPKIKGIIFSLKSKGKVPKIRGYYISVDPQSNAVAKQVVESKGPNQFVTRANKIKQKIGPETDIAVYVEKKK